MIKNFIMFLFLSFVFLLSSAQAHDIGKSHSHDVNYDEAEEDDDYYVIQEELFKCPELGDDAPCYTNVAFVVPYYEFKSIPEKDQTNSQFRTFESAIEHSK